MRSNTGGPDQSGSADPRPCARRSASLLLAGAAASRKNPPPGHSPMAAPRHRVGRSRGSPSQPGCLPATAAPRAPPRLLENPMRPTPVAVDAPEYSVPPATSAGKFTLRQARAHRCHRHGHPELEFHREKQEATGASRSAGGRYKQSSDACSPPPFPPA